MFGNSKEIEALRKEIKALTKKVDFLENELNEFKKKDKNDDFELPLIPWIAEIDRNPNNEIFQSIDIKTKISIWSGLLNAIGINHEKEQVLNYSYMPSEEELEKFNMLSIGQIVFSIIGNLAIAKNNNYNALNLGEYSFDSSLYEKLIYRIIKLGLPNSEIENLHVSNNNGSVEVSYELNSDFLELSLEPGKYLDAKFTEKVIATIKDQTDHSRGYFYLSTDFGIVLTYLTFYQKNIIDRLFKLKRKLQFLTPYENDKV